MNSESKVKIKNRENIRLRRLGSKYMIVNASEQTVLMSDVYTLNETAAFLMTKCIEYCDFEAEQLAVDLTQEYEVSYEQALSDVNATIDCWRKSGLLED